jgi:hypothetical protein
MLYEIRNIDQKEKNLKRKWFYDYDLDLLIWLDRKNEIYGFQLCYDKDDNPHALTWFVDKGFFHNKIDEGDNKIGRRRGSPLLIANGVFDSERIANYFKMNSHDIEAKIAKFVYDKILEYR